MDLTARATAVSPLRTIGKDRNLLKGQEETTLKIIGNNKILKVPPFLWTIGKDRNLHMGQEETTLKMIGNNKILKGQEETTAAVPLPLQIGQEKTTLAAVPPLRTSGSL